MSLKVPYVGAIALQTIDQARWNTGGTKLTLKLYKSNTTPANGDTAATYTEADFNGYAAVTLDNWTPPATVGGKAQMQPDPVTFTKGVGGAGNNIYGYYVVDNVGTLLWAERDAAAPIDMSTNGNTYTVLARFTGVSEF